MSGLTYTSGAAGTLLPAGVGTAESGAGDPGPTLHSALHTLTLVARVTGTAEPSLSTPPRQGTIYDKCKIRKTGTIFRFYHFRKTKT